MTWSRSAPTPRSSWGAWRSSAISGATSGHTSATSASASPTCAASETTTAWSSSSRGTRGAFVPTAARSRDPGAPPSCSHSATAAGSPLTPTSRSPPPDEGYPMEDLVVRAFNPGDYPSVIEVLNAVHPDYPDTVEELRFYDEHRDPKCRFDRWLAIRGGSVVGVGQCGHAAGWFHPRKFWMDLSVHPDHQGRGVGSLLYRQILETILPLDPLVIRAGAREDKLHSIQFLLNRG